MINIPSNYIIINIWPLSTRRISWDKLQIWLNFHAGWDRTAQVCSIAQVLIDPYYRTLQGVQALIEKDWLSFGHKFTDRCGYLQGDQKETAPVFTQLVDSIWQLTRAYPTAFQYSERFLLHLHDHVYSCQFGTFVGNGEKDRLDLKVLSLINWSFQRR